MLDLVLRWVHLLPAAILIGSTFYIRLVVLPNAEPGRSDSEHGQRQRKALARLLRTAGGGLLVSGLINSVRLIQVYDFGAVPYHAFVALKLVLALAAIGLVDRLVGDGPSADKLRKNEKALWTVVLILVTLLLGLGGFMRSIERTPKESQPSTSASVPMDASTDGVGGMAPMA